MFKYKLGEDIYNVPENEVDIFEAETPDAIKITELNEGKTNGAVETDAAVAPTPDTASESTESDSANTSGELQPGEQGYYRQERIKGRPVKEIRAENYKASGIDKKVKTKKNENGELVFGDQRDLTKQITDYQNPVSYTHLTLPTTD